MTIDPFLSALSADYVLPPYQSIANAAVIAVFAYLVPLLTMEINYFRLAVYKSWRRQVRRVGKEQQRLQLANVAAAASEAAAVAATPATLESETTAAAEADDDGYNFTAIIQNKENISNNHDDDEIDEIENGDCNSTSHQSICSSSSDCSSSSSSDSAVGHLMNDLQHYCYGALHNNRLSRSNSTNSNMVCNIHYQQDGDYDDGNCGGDDDVTNDDGKYNSSSNNISTNDGGKGVSDVIKNDQLLQRAYRTIRISSLQAILSSLFLYAITAAGVAINTRGLDPKVIAIIIGASQFMTALMVVIVTAKVPQWIGVYHQGAIRLVKCSSNYSQDFERINLHDLSNIQKLKWSVRLGVWFHFAKFYIILLPFYCGVQRVTIPLSMITGTVFGFSLMWAVFVVHEKYLHRRNIVSCTTIFLLSIISAWAFARGIAWMQVVWMLNIIGNQDLLVVVSFFAWLGLLAVVHVLFLWHTLKMEERTSAAAAAAAASNTTAITATSSSKNIAKEKNASTMRRNSSYSSFIFDPRTHFKDGKCQFSDHPDLVDSFTLSTEKDDEVAKQQRRASSHSLAIDSGNEDESDGPVMMTMSDYDYSPGSYTETTSAAMIDAEPELDGNKEGGVNTNSLKRLCSEDSLTTRNNVKRRCPSCCEVFICFSPEYRESSCLWKFICWVKIIIITLAYLLCLYFVAVSIGATDQISSTRAKLPSVHEEIYTHMNEGPVCAFDDRGPQSNIATFANKEAAHDAGFLVLHCGACGACSSWDNLIVEFSTRNTMSELANQCAQEALFGGGGNDIITKCLMKPEIGFDEQCATCWMEDILCVKDHCAFIFLQSQMINNVGNFAVGPNDITSASCEEAHCEVGLFVPCSGATRRRMNITSSISRPGDQLCNIVDVEDWEDLFYGSPAA